MKSLKKFEGKAVKNAEAVKGGADGKGTKTTAAGSKGKPELL